MKSFFEKLTNKKEEKSEFDKLLALVKSQDPNLDTITCRDECSDDNLADMCLAIQENKNITSFKIKNKSIEPSIEFLSSLCASTRSLTELRLSNAGIGEHESNCLVAALLNNKSIRTLAVDHNNITNPDCWAQLLKINKTLESLDLSNNRLTATKGSDSAMSIVATSLVGNMKVRDLYLQGNGFTDTSVQKLLAVIADKGDTMGIRSLDLVNDSSLPQSTRDAISAAMARPWASGNAAIQGLKKARVAEDADGDIIITQQQVARKPRPKQKKSSAAAAASSTGGGGGGEDDDETENTTTVAASAADHVDTTNLASAVTKAQQQHQQENNNNNNKSNTHSNEALDAMELDAADVSVSNMSFSTENTVENSPNNLSASISDPAALKAAKLAKLKEMKMRHVQEIKKRDLVEKELRNQIDDLVCTVGKLTKDVAAANSVADAAKQASAIATAAAAAATAASTEETINSSRSNRSNNNNEDGGSGRGDDERVQHLQQQLSAAKGSAAASAAQAASLESEVQHLREHLSQSKENYQKELAERDAKLSRAHEEGDTRASELAMIASNQAAEHEQTKQQASQLRGEIEKLKQQHEQELLAQKNKYEQKEKVSQEHFLIEKNVLNSKIKMMESKVESAESRSQQLSSANRELEKTASAEISKLRSQVESTLVSFNEKLFSSSSSGSGEPSSPSRIADTKVSRDVIVQTDPLPTFPKGALASAASGGGGGVGGLGGSSSSVSGMGGGGGAGMGSLNFGGLSKNRAQTMSPQHHQGGNRAASDLSGSTPQQQQQSGIPSIDVSSVTRFKVPSSQSSKLGSPGSDDEFVGDSDEDRQEGGSQQAFGKVPKSKWEKDELVAHCRGCKAEFTFYLRRHHCRQCGKVYCDDCSPVSKMEGYRMCHLCVSSKQSQAFFRQ